MPKLRACIVGHSFVRRLGEDLCKGNHGEAPSPSTAADELFVNKQFNKIHIFGNESFLVKDLVKNICKAGKLRPDCVIIHCGSNDLCKKECDVKKIVDGLVSFANFLRISYEVKHVSLLAVAGRTKCRDVSNATFRDRAETFNKQLKEAVEASNHACRKKATSFVYLKGFCCDKEGNELPVSVWSSDGIHPATGSKRSQGMEKYRRLMRKSLLAGAGIVHKR